MTKRLLLLVNRHSRRGDSPGLALAAARLAAGGMRVTTVPAWSHHQGGIAAALRAHGRDTDLILIAGGDGTMNAAAPALLELGRPFAILPLGTANDLARTLGIPQQPLAAADLVLAGRTRRIDLGEVNGHPFFNVASVGLSVRVAQALKPELKRRFGTLSYPLTVYRVLRQGKAFSAEIGTDGGERVALRSIQLAVGNGRFYGGGMVIAEDAAIDDHTLHLYSLKPQPLWKLAWRALDLRRGRHDDPQSVLALSGRSFEVTTRRPMRVNTDGEVTTRTPARFSVLPAALEVVVP